MNEIIEPIIKRGKNAKNNWEIYDEAEQFHTIFHIDNLTSPYVIINLPMNELTNQQIAECGNLCKEHSKHKHIKVTMLYTEISNTYKGNVLGQFIIKSDKLVKRFNI